MLWFGAVIVAQQPNKIPVPGKITRTEVQQGKSVVDSLLALLPTSTATGRIALLNRLVEEYVYIDLGESERYQQEALKLARYHNDKPGEAAAILNGALVHRSRGNFSPAFEQATTAMSMFRALPLQSGIAKAHYQLGLIHQLRSNYYESRSQYLQSLAISEAIGDVFQSARTYNAISEDYMGQGDREQGLEYALRSLMMHRQHHDKRWLAIQLDNVGFIYEQQGNAAKALEYYYETYSLLLSIGKKGGSRLPNSCKNIANALRKLGHYETGILWAKQGLELSNDKTTSSLNGYRGSSRALAELYEAQQNYTLALEWNLRALTLPHINANYAMYLCASIVRIYIHIGDCQHAKEYAYKSREYAQMLGNPRAHRDSQRMIADALEHCGDFPGAFAAQKQFQRLNDSLVNIDKTREIARLQAVHEVERRRRENEHLVQENQTKESVIARQTAAVIAVMGLLCCTIVVAVLFYRANKQKKRINLQLHDINIELDTALHELKETQTQLVAGERLGAIGLLTAGVMHEINNPNAAVYAALEQITLKNSALRAFFGSLLDEQNRQAPEAQRFFLMSDEMAQMLSIALSGSARINHIVASLRHFSKHQEDGIKTDLLENELISTIEIFRYQFKNVEVVAKCRDIGLMTANFGEMNQVFLNLFVNAAQAEATCIHIIGKRDTSIGTVEIIVKDNGRGISPETLSMIFEPFYSTKGAGNSGLGLSISKTILGRHNAVLLVESQIGIGTTFTIRFMQP